MFPAEERSNGHDVIAGPEPHPPWYVWLSATALAITTGAIRYLNITGFSNDHYLHLAGAQQLLLGEWPTRDFVDLGAPLMFVTSAGMQWLLGRTLFAEAVLVAVMFGVTAGALVVAGWRLSRSLAVGMAASSLSIIAFPRPYGYPKLLFFVIVPLLIWSWMRQPTARRLAAIAIAVSIAFLFRHDIGVYLAIAALAGIGFTPSEHPEGNWLRIAIFAGIGAVCLIPYFWYVQMHGGLLTYFQESLAFSQREADRTKLTAWPIGLGAEARLFYLFRVLPFVALAWLTARWKRGWSLDDLMGVPLAVGAVFAEAAFVRDPLSARLPDVIVPVALVGAWLAGRAMALPTRAVRVASIGVVSLVAGIAAVSLAATSNAGEQLSRTNLWLGIGEIPRVFRARTQQLVARFDQTQVPDVRVVSMLPFFEYLDRCTTPRHRLLVTGNAPELYVYAQRPFAAGQPMFIEGYFQSERAQQLQLDRMAKQVVAFVLVLSDQFDDWRKGFPRLQSFVDARFRALTDVHIDATRSVRVLVHAGLPPTRVDLSTGWPCYT